MKSLREAPKDDFPDALAALDEDEDISLRPVGAVILAVIIGAVVALLFIAGRISA